MNTPRVADWLLRLLVPRELRTDILGDLHEEFRRFTATNSSPIRARFWYWRQVLGSGLGYQFARRNLRSKHGTPMARGTQGVFQDLRFGIRTLRRRPLFTGIALLTLGVGIGGSTAVFCVVDGVLFRHLPYSDADRIVNIWTADPGWHGLRDGTHGWERIPYAYSDFLELRSGASLIEGVSAYVVLENMTLTGEGRPEQLSVGHVSADLFPMLGIHPVLGRGFLPSEEGMGDIPAQRVTLLSYEMWQRRFGGESELIGNAIMLDHEPFVVIGVLPPAFRLENKHRTDWDKPDKGDRDVWVPIGQVGSELDSRGPRFDVFGRAKPGTTLPQIRAEATGLLRNDGGEHDREVRVAVRHDVVTRGYGNPLLLALAGSGILLAIACANMASLLLGEALGRKREIATRAALGAGLGRISRQLISESLILGLLGAALGAAIADAGVQALLKLAPPIPRLEEVSVSWRVLFFAASSGVFASLAFSLAPIVLVARRSLNTAMVGGIRGTTTRARSFQGKVVAFQIALSAVLLVVGGLFARSLLKLADVNPGFDISSLAVLQLNASVSRYPSEIDATNMFGEVVRALEAVPGVRSVSGSQGLPFPGYAHLNSAQIVADGEDGWFLTRRRSIFPTYHETLGIPLVEGRYLAPTVGADAPREMVVSQSLAETRWPSRSPIGALISFWGEDWIVVGVVGDVRHTSLRQGGEPTFYVPLAHTPQRDVSVVVRTESNAASMFPQLRDAVWSVDSDLAFGTASTMSQLVGESTASDRYRTSLVLVFALLATLLAGAGVFGVTANIVAQRTREIGIRTALGAQVRDVQGMVLKSGLTYALVGSAIGLLAAVASSRLISAYLFGITQWDPVTYAGVGALLLLVAMLAAYLPARRATRVDPVQVLCDQ